VAVELAAERAGDYDEVPAMSHEGLDALRVRLREFARERDWEQFHTPKNLAMALAGEVGELLEIFQWLTPEQAAEVMDSAGPTTSATSSPT
jgi:hypothetical protein